MTLSSTFFDKVKYKSQDFAARDADIFGSGVRNLTDFPIVYPATPNMTVNIGAGVARVNGGYRIANDSNPITLTFAAADPTNPRVDIIQIGYTATTDGNGDTIGTPILQVKQGVPGVTPIEPGADPNFVKLYAVNINANQTTVTESNVVDRRTLWTLNVDGSQITNNGSVTTGDAAYQAVKNETYVQAGAGIETSAAGSGFGQTISLADGGITDSKIGNRTADPTLQPSGLVGTLTQWLSWLTNRIKAITGTTNWYDAPPTTLQSVSDFMAMKGENGGLAELNDQGLVVQKASSATNADHATSADSATSATSADSAAAAPWSGITDKPTTVAGYGISDAVKKTGDTMTGALGMVEGSTLAGREMLPNYDQYFSNPGNNGVNTFGQYKRPDGTLFMDTTLSNPDSNGYYQTNTQRYYDAAGTGIIATRVWSLTYDAYGNCIQKVMTS